MEGSRGREIGILKVLPVTPWQLRSYRIYLQCRRPGFNPWAGKIVWRKEWQPISVFLPREFHGQRSLLGYSPWDHTRVGHD